MILDTKSNIKINYFSKHRQQGRRKCNNNSNMSIIISPRNIKYLRIVVT